MQKFLCNTFIALCLVSFLSTKAAASELEVLSWTPRIFVVHNFLSPEECDHLITTSAPYLNRSVIVDTESGKGAVDKMRTSSSMFFPDNYQDDILREIENRIALMTFVPAEYSERMQVVRYEVGQEYKPHYDYFDNSVGGKINIQRGGQRLISFLMYLNTPEEGGQTLFPYANVGVQPHKGDALIFFNCDLNGNLDPLTLHAGAPVTKGEKWLATKWLHPRRFE